MRRIILLYFRMLTAVDPWSVAAVGCCLPVLELLLVLLLRLQSVGTYSVPIDRTIFAAVNKCQLVMVENSID